MQSPGTSCSIDATRILVLPSRVFAERPGWCSPIQSQLTWEDPAHVTQCPSFSVCAFTLRTSPSPLPPSLLLPHNNTTDSDKSNIAISTHEPNPSHQATLPSHVFQGLFRLWFWFWFWLQRPELQRHKQRHKLPGSPNVPFYCILPYPDHRQGNHYCSRDYGSSAANSNSYHYSNSDSSLEPGS